MRRYNPKVIEPKWQKIWDESKIYQAKEDKSKPKKYVLEYFPYPSGVAMHVGHVRNYTIGDAMARHSRMTGHNVLHPMGWDAFGLPAENYAIKNNLSPRAATERNIKTFKQQLIQMGFSYDWSREIDSSNPDYYHWTQWLFLQFFKKGLAYRAKSLQNWCPTDKTVLANEQVINKNGVNVCERDGTPVTQKEIEQWFLKITDYADRLVDDLDDLDWPENIKVMQRNWIGRSKGALITFAVASHQSTVAGKKGIDVFTTRPDTLYGATYMVLAPEHPLVSKLTVNSQQSTVNSYVKETLNKTELDRKEAEKDKTGVFTGAHAINPANKEKIPIWIADYVLMSYGTGAIMAVPAHDERDWEFATKYNLPIQTVIARDFGEHLPDEQPVEGVVVIAFDPKSGLYLGLDEWNDGIGLVGGGKKKDETFEASARRELAEEAGLHDVEELIQLGTPIYSHYYNDLKKINRFSYAYAYLAIVNSQTAKKTKLEAHETFKPAWFSIDEIRSGILRVGGGVEHWLEITERAEEAAKGYLRGKEYQSTTYDGEGILVNSAEYSGMSSNEAREKIVADLAKKGLAKEQTQYRLRDWTVSRQRYWGCPIPIVYCDKDGIVPAPEEDLPVLLPENVKFKPTGQSPLKNLPEFVNVKCPRCGGPAQRETDTFDTFIDSSWYFLRFTDPQNKKEPFSEEKVNRWMPVDSYIGGAEHAVVHLLYARFWTKVLADIGLVNTDEPFKSLRNHGMIGGPDGRKMGKRYGNVVTPDELIEQGYGADALRLYELFIGPYDQGVDWNPRGIAGTYRFLDRLWTLAQEFLGGSRVKGQGSRDGGHNTELEVQIKRTVHKTVKRVSQDMEKLGFNTAIASLMECVNELYKIKSKHNFALAYDAWRDGLITLIQLLAPFAPHISEELWEELGQSGSVHVSRWPAWDDSLIAEDMVTLAVQVNGKVRAEIMVPIDISEAEAIESAKKEDKIAKLVADKTIKKAIYIPGRLVSLVF